MIYTNITVTLPDIKNEQGFEVKDKGNGVRYLYYTKNSVLGLKSPFRPF